VDILLDTCTILWLVNGNSDKIPKYIVDIVQDTSNCIYYSTVSIFEIATKVSIGKLEINIDELVTCLHNNGVCELYIKPLHLTYYALLPFVTPKNSVNQKPHKDPFDRLLISQSVRESLYFCTNDTIITTSYTNIDGLKLLNF
jgi:PIN domain nuclease of toxin-antitoxin system